MAENLYYGIDLGTTNSAIAYGYVDSNKKVTTQVCKINRYGREGGIEAKETLPSVVYYKYDMKKNCYNPIIGDFAKNQFGKKYGSVMKSVKNYMGELVTLPLDEKIDDKRPQDVSAKILNHLVLGIKEKLTLAETPKNVIITIPASFDPDQRRATLEAAEIAGINVKDKNGNYLENILLSEPKAVIYNIANMISNKEIPLNVLDFSEKKNVLVFDLGGGTLDVALYCVYDNKEFNFPIIDELAIGRYTQIGGDSFDKVLSKKLVDDFIEYNGCSPDDVDLDELTQLMESRAEFLKLELSDKVFNAKFAGSQVSDDEEFEISEMDIYKGMEFEDYLTKSDIEKVYEPILARHLSLNDINRIEKLVSDEDMKNIVFPVLDVLAKYKRGGHDLKIDAVVLNGGMTKFYLIKDRIKELFNIDPITVNDPDLAVAKGAAFFQYCSEKVNFLEKIQNTPSILTEGKEKKNIVELNNLKNFEKEIDFITNNQSSTSKSSSTPLTLGNVIVNETINLGLTKGHAKLLVKEGTKLPIKDIKLENLVIPVNTKEIELPIYLGNEPRTDSPHMRKINTRKIVLNKTYAPGTPITLNLTIDENKNLYFNGYVGDNQYERISVIMETTKSNNDEKASKIVSTDSKELNIGTEMETLRTSAVILEDIKKRYNGVKKTTYINSRFNDAKFKIDQTKTDIINSTNKEKFENAIIDELGKLENHRLLKGILFDLGSQIYDSMSTNGKKNFVKACENMLCLEYMLNNYNKDNIKKAIIALERIGETNKEKEIEKLLDKSAARNYHENLARALAKISKYNKKIITNFLTISVESLEINPYIYGIGETFNTDEMLYLEESTINAILERLLKILKQKRANRDMALTAMIKIFKNLEEQKYDIDERLFKRMVADIKVLIEEEFDDKFKTKLLNGFSKMIDVK
ncbi:Hsp70 family protein [uncultured Fusobacterium sp.]|uniref:Hsp70 family protein n=1 Tax=uncultured Fusobacterium sp. TaxID=159267 RepID=UPI0025F36177|nr:Hsp70 family protein [uncultured Fusobacterium sp.]